MERDVAGGMLWPAGVTVSFTAPYRSAGSPARSSGVTASPATSLIASPPQRPQPKAAGPAAVGERVWVWTEADEAGSNMWEPAEVTAVATEAGKVTYSVRFDDAETWELEDGPGISRWLG
eukprot:TRINITY_DN2953_c0_g1_i4.p1 TRINITY_DN2953_c0_g1~~TRINITY_DN2953_c0_g1_i4.p1  ORF type:complete len:135 (+),score=41.11 TRINITY_DN2953_c0_g1_i4:47-406(+)